jgi:hypothetical protein
LHAPAAGDDVDALAVVPFGTVGVAPADDQVRRRRAGGVHAADPDQGIDAFEPEVGTDGGLTGGHVEDARRLQQRTGRAPIVARGQRRATTDHEHVGRVERDRAVVRAGLEQARRREARRVVVHVVRRQRPADQHRTPGAERGDGRPAQPLGRGQRRRQRHRRECTIAQVVAQDVAGRGGHERGRAKVDDLGRRAGRRERADRTQAVGRQHRDLHLERGADRGLPRWRQRTRRPDRDDLATGAQRLDRDLARVVRHHQPDVPRGGRVERLPHLPGLAERAHQQGARSAEPRA